MSSHDILDAALQYAARGWQVFPLSPGSKLPWKGSHGFKDATADPATIEAWWQEQPRSNLALATGEIVVLDPDGPEGMAELQTLAKANGGLPRTLTAKTGKGWHFYYRAPAGVTVRSYNAPRKVKGGDGLDVKGAGGFVVLPPSKIRKTGAVYRWAFDAPMAELPAWIVAWLAGKRRGDRQEAMGIPASGGQGARGGAWAGLGEAPEWLARGSGRRLADEALDQMLTREWPRVFEALKVIPANCNYETWFAHGAAIHSFDSGPRGLAAFKWWAWQSEAHQDETHQIACERKWIEYGKPKPGKALITIASLYAAAIEAKQEEKREEKAAIEGELHRGENNVSPNKINGMHALPAALVKVANPIFVDLDANGEPKGTSTNAAIAIAALGVECSKDTFHEKMIVGGQLVAQWAGDLSDDAVHILRRLAKAEYGFDPGERNMRDAAIALCLEHPFNPVCEYLGSVEQAWDGQKRIGRWVVDYLGAGDTALNREFGRLMLIAAVRRARAPGCKFDQIIVMEGREGTGKSSAIRILAGDDNFSDQNVLAASDKEQQEASCGVWLHEIAELAGMRRTDVERVKQFASRTEDRARPAYGRIRVDMKRRGILIATTNEEIYLKSETGNRRFWPIATGKIDLEGLKRDRGQLWGEAARLETSGASIVLEERFRAIANEEQEARLEGDPWHEYVVKYIEGKADVSTGEVLKWALEFDSGRITMTDQIRVGRILAREKWLRYRKRTGNTLTWRYRMGTVGIKSA